MFTRNALLQSTSRNALLRRGYQKCYVSNSSLTATATQNSLLEEHDMVSLVHEREQLHGVPTVGGMNLELGHRDLALGLRSSKPPDSVGSSSPGTKKAGKTPRKGKGGRGDGDGVELPDAEWEIRTGSSASLLSYYSRLDSCFGLKEELCSCYKKHCLNSSKLV